MTQSGFTNASLRQSMKVGDLVKFTKNSMLGLIVSIRSRETKDISPALFRVQWADGIYSNRFQNELEIVNEAEKISEN